MYLQCTCPKHLVGADKPWIARHFSREYLHVLFLTYMYVPPGAPDLHCIQTCGMKSLYMYIVDAIAAVPDIRVHTIPYNNNS